MNKNTKRRHALLAKENRGHWGTPGTKKKKKNFPTISGNSEPMTLAAQRRIFTPHGN